MSQREWSEAFRADRDRIRDEMGGADRVERVHARGSITIRERIDRLLDAGSFLEIGTFARSARLEDKDSTPGDGKVGGLGKIDGRAVCVVGDDVTVMHGSSSQVSSKRVDRIYEHALEHGHGFLLALLFLLLSLMFGAGHIGERGRLLALHQGPGLQVQNSLGLLGRGHRQFLCSQCVTL